MTTNEQYLLRSAVARFFADGGAETVTSALAAAAEAREAFTRELGVQLQKPLNEYLGSQEQDSFSDKAHLTNSLNLQLEKLGLAIQHPESGDCTRLKAIRTDDDRGAYVFGEADFSKFDSIPTLEFVPAPAGNCEQQREPRLMPSWSR